MIHRWPGKNRPRSCSTTSSPPSSRRIEESSFKNGHEDDLLDGGSCRHCVRLPVPAVVPSGAGCDKRVSEPVPLRGPGNDRETVRGSRVRPAGRPYSEGVRCGADRRRRDGRLSIPLVPGRNGETRSGQVLPRLLPDRNPNKRSRQGDAGIGVPERIRDWGRNHEMERGRAPHRAVAPGGAAAGGGRSEVKRSRAGSPHGEPRTESPSEAAQPRGSLFGFVAIFMKRSTEEYQRKAVWISAALLRWFRTAARAMAWRETRDP